MEPFAQGQRLRIFVGDSDKYEGKCLSRWLVQKAKDLGLQGATVYRGCEGFGTHRVIHTTKFVDLMIELPMIVEIIDSRESIESFMPLVERAVKEGMITVEDIRMRVFRRTTIAK